MTRSLVQTTQYRNFAFTSTLHQNKQVLVPTTAWFDFILLLLCTIGCFFVSGCGYHFSSLNNHWEKSGVTKLYIEPLVNNTLRAGSEVVFTSALLKEFSRQKKIKLVTSAKDANGILRGSIDSISNRVNTTTSADSVSTTIPESKPRPPSDFRVAAEMQVSIGITITLTQIGEGLADTKMIWNKSLNRSRLYPAANLGGDIGNTSVLINESRLNTSVAELATTMASEMHTLMFEAF